MRSRALPLDKQPRERPYNRWGEGVCKSIGTLEFHVPRLVNLFRFGEEIEDGHR
jgi:hypothetical protein